MSTYTLEEIAKRGRVDVMPFLDGKSKVNQARIWYRPVLYVGRDKTPIVVGDDVFDDSDAAYGVAVDTLASIKRKVAKETK